MVTSYRVFGLGKHYYIIEISIKWPCLGVLLSPPTPYFNPKPCYPQSEETLLSLKFISQYVMHDIWNDIYENNKHSNNENA